jgi:hypothetical protein
MKQKSLNIQAACLNLVETPTLIYIGFAVDLILADTSSLNALNLYLEG